MSGLSMLVARAIELVRIHRIQQEPDRIIKHRKLGMGLVIAAGNVFLKLSRSRILMFARAADWRAWELHSFALVNGDAHPSGALGRAIWTGRVPGKSLLDHLNESTLDADMLRAAGRALARAHSLYSEGLDGPWSHGDPHLANVLVTETGAARLIDFETIHEPGLSAHDRHADDLLVLLLDLLGRVPQDRLLELSSAFLQGYARPKITPALRARLKMPKGLELALWHTRTHFCGRATLNAQLRALKAHLERSLE